MFPMLSCMIYRGILLDNGYQVHMIHGIVVMYMMVVMVWNCLLGIALPIADRCILRNLYMVHYN